MIERKDGWYWVRARGAYPEWEAGLCLAGSWTLAGDSDSWADDELVQIGPRIPTPDEPWQTVPVELIDWIRGAQRLMRALPDGGGWPAAAKQADMLLAAAPTPGGGDE